MAWVRGAAIRPVPRYAVVELPILESIERELAREGEEARVELDEAFHRFETTQPYLAERVSAVLARRLDDTALALGYFLSIAVWLAFERRFSARLALVTDDAMNATEAALALEEELRATHAEEPLDLDDVVAMEQPGVLSFVHGHVEAALEPIPLEKAGDDRHDVDVDDVHLVYRTILMLTLALSHAVMPDGAHPLRGGGSSSEMMA